MSDRITLKEFRAWLDGLLSGREMEREALPTRDQWAKILAKLDAIEDPANVNAPKPSHSPYDYREIFSAPSIDRVGDLIVYSGGTLTRVDPYRQLPE